MKILGTAVVLTAATAAAACTAVTVQPTHPHPFIEQQRSDGLGEERRLSALAGLWLRKAAAHDPSQPRERGAMLAAYLEAARASYAYLFLIPRQPGALESRESQVRDVYNEATERVTTLLFEEARQRGRLDDPSGGSILRAGSWVIRRGLIDVRLPAGRPLRDLIAASRLSAGGLRNTYRRDGLVAAFVAVADSPSGSEEEAGAVRETGYAAASVVLRFAGSSLKEVMATHAAELDAYDSGRHESLPLYGLEVRLAANITAPYALWLERSHFGRQAKRSLVGRNEELLEPRIFLMQPYDPDRRTVVLIHGLASSPRAWIDLGNELTGDEEIRRHFQVWEVFYRSSAPIAYNEHAIRRALEETLDRFDPERTATASRRMVLVGHSMGGVIARLLVLDTGDALWQGLLGHAPDDEQRQRLAVLSPYLDLAPMPEVGRAVFLASPHRGSPLAGGWPGRLAARLIRLPGALMAKAGEIADALEREAPAVEVRAGPDGVDFLSDRRPYLEILAKRPIAPWVTYHSLIGCRKPGPLAECSDGLVPYASAHLDGAASELIVHSGHSVQGSPEAILELRRILHLHLAEP